MDVLMTEETSPLTRCVAAHLRQSGHRVHVCHTSVSGFVCSALAGLTCPLEAGAIDAAVCAAHHGGSEPLLREEGVACAIRRRIPVVLVDDAGTTEAGDTPVVGAGGSAPAVDDPFAPWISAACVPRSAAKVIDDVVAAPRVGHSHAAQESAARILDRLAVGGPVHAEVRRSHGRLTARVEVPRECPHDAQSACAVKVAGDLRIYDPWAQGINVDVRVSDH